MIVFWPPEFFGRPSLFIFQLEVIETTLLCTMCMFVDTVRVFLHKARYNTHMSSFEAVMEKVQAVANRPRKDAMGHLYVEKILRNAHFQGDISTDAADLTAFSTDESIFCVRPQVIIAPKTLRDVQVAVKAIALHTDTFPALSLTPRAAGTGLSGGSLTDSIVLDMKKYFTSIAPYNAATGTINVGPGVMFPLVEAALKKHGRYLPAFPASKDICTIGGCVGNNAAGPDSLRFGHFANSVAALEVVLHDGNVYQIKPLSLDGYKALISQNTELARIAKAVFTLIKKNESSLQKARPKTKKNTAGYPLWDVLSTSVKEFESGNGTFDLTRLFCGSQGTIGIVTSVTLKTEPIHNNTVLMAVPVYELPKAGELITKVLEYNPINVELFDGASFELAVAHPNFFRDRVSGFAFYHFMYALYSTYYLSYRAKAPEFTLLITIDTTETEHSAIEIVKEVRTATGLPIKIVNNPHRKEMLWQVRRASYTLSKLQDPTKRPAAFLEDMTVPPKHIAAFFVDIKKLLKKHKVQAAVHGHGGNGHLHFYPLLDFTKDQSEKVTAMAEDFFATAIKYEGNICGEHNDGIIRTPHLSKIYPKPIIKLFEEMEHAFDPTDIFNPGKKVNPRYDIKEYLRHTN